MGDWCLIVIEDWEWNAPVKVVGERGCECAAAPLNKGGNLLLELEGVCDDAWGLIKVKDSLVELPPVVIHALLHRGCVQGAMSRFRLFVRIDDLLLLSHLYFYLVR